MKARIPNAAGGNMMKKIQQMQEDMARIQGEIEESEFSASSGGGVVEAAVSGKHEVLSVVIQKEAVDPDDVEMLQDLVIAAVNEAIRKASEAMEKGLEEAKGGLSLPGLF
ncbi:MAG: YbaB/EbfC family nucleoid-associated protein [Clostridiales bacterium]|nr:YbaB/EbfC family nucleoid-associated protein [Clostridiales bacterium]